MTERNEEKMLSGGWFSDDAEEPERPENSEELFDPEEPSEDSRLGEFIQDEDAVSPEEAAEQVLLRDALVAALNTLTERERTVLILRFGFDGGQPQTLEQVGQYFDVTRERIRQIETKALRKLRHPSRAKLIQGYQR